jgi:hypothetical protein
MSSASFPDTVSFYAELGVSAARRKSRVGGGWRLYVLAKALDRVGRGSISREDLRRYATSLGVSPRQWERWIAEARHFGLVRDVPRSTSAAIISRAR